MTRNIALAILFVVSTFFFVVILFFIANPVYAINDVPIDGDLGDWADETGFYTDTYGDAIPPRTDITQYGIAVVDVGAMSETLAIMMVTDDFQGNGPEVGDSHQMVFYIGLYEIVVQINNYCNFVNWVEIDGTPVTISAREAFTVTNIYDDPPDSSTTWDCAMQLVLPISELPLLDSNGDGELLDEEFLTTFATRQSGGVGNDNDQGDSEPLYPNAISLSAFSARTSTGTNVIPYLVIGSAFVLVVIVYYRRYKRVPRV